MNKNIKKPPMGAGKQQTQALVCREIWQQVVSESFGKGKVADRALAGIMRGRKELGSRDRRFISETIFGFFRFWGILQLTLTADERQKLASGNCEIGDLTVSKLLLGSALLNFNPVSLPEAAGVWANHLRIKLPVQWSMESIGKLLNAEEGWNNPEKLMPDWIEKYISPELDRGNIFAALASRPPLWLRFQLPEREKMMAELNALGVELKPHPICPDAFAVMDGRINLYALDAFKRGGFEVQDLASQAIGMVCAPKPGERWWDCCAGAGGKTLQLASLMKRKGTVIATDIREYKLDDLRKRARRSGFPNITAKEWDGKKLRAKDQGNFDGVLVDAPCSCSGTWRRNPDARWLLEEPEIEELANLQLSILNNGSCGVKPGGVLVYATCSMFELENMNVVNKFLAGNSEFELEEFKNPLTGIPAPGYVQSDMMENNSDTMFAARFRRKNKTQIE